MAVDGKSALAQITDEMEKPSKGCYGCAGMQLSGTRSGYVELSVGNNTQQL